MNSYKIEDLYYSIFDKKENSDITIKSSTKELYLHKNKILNGEFNFLKKNTEFSKNDKYIDLSLYSHNSLLWFFNMIYFENFCYDTFVFNVLKVLNKNDSSFTVEERIQCIDLNNLYECNGKRFKDPTIYCDKDDECIKLSKYYHYPQIKKKIDKYLLHNDCSIDFINNIYYNVSDCIISFDQKKLINKKLSDELEKRKIILLVTLKLKYRDNKSLIENKRFLDYILYLNKYPVFRNLESVKELDIDYDSYGFYYEFDKIKDLTRFEVPHFYHNIKTIEELKFGLEFIEIPEILDRYVHFFNFFNSNYLSEKEIDILLSLNDKFNEEISAYILTSTLKSDNIIDKINKCTKVEWNVFVDDDNLNFKKIMKIKKVYFHHYYEKYDKLEDLTGEDLQFYLNYVDYSKDLKNELIDYFNKKKIQKKQCEFILNNGNLIENKTLNIYSSSCNDTEKLNIFSEKYNIKWKIFIDQQKPDFKTLKNVDIIVSDLKSFNFDNISVSNKLIIMNTLIEVKNLVNIDKKINELYVSNSTIRNIDELKLLKNLKVLYFGIDCKFLVKKSNKKFMKTIDIISTYLKEFIYYDDDYLNFEFVCNKNIKKSVTYNNDLIKTLL